MQGQAYYRKPIVKNKLLSSSANFHPAACGKAFWWERVDSNHRRRCQQIYSLSPLATRELSHKIRGILIPLGAGGRTRTPDLLITNQLLYRLSYTSALLNARIILSQVYLVVNSFSEIFLKNFFIVGFCCISGLKSDVFIEKYYIMMYNNKVIIFSGGIKCQKNIMNI